MAGRMGTVREAVIGLLRELGMTTIFGNPGSTELPLFRNFPDDFRYVLGLQESVVVGMADGYAQATGNAAFVNLHSAAGVGHAMGNIFTAYRNRTPMVITAGQQARSILPYEPFLFASAFTQLDGLSVTIRQPLTVDDIVGRAFSMSVSSEEALGARVEEFTATLSQALRELSPDGTFTEVAELVGLLARRP